jgi:hypothetical protein
MDNREISCARRTAIAKQNMKILNDMHPKVPVIVEKTQTIKGLMVICDTPTFELLHQSQKEPFGYLCKRCKIEIGGLFEEQGHKIRPIIQPSE